MAAVGIHFGPAAKRQYVSLYSQEVLAAVMKHAGVHTLWITSTYRDAHDQARVMVHNIEQKGMKHQKTLYRGTPGARILESFAREAAAIAEAARRGINTGLPPGFVMQRHMIGVIEREIDRMGPENVSRHSGIQGILNVFDVAPESLIPNRRSAFHQAALHDPRVTRIIPPPRDPAFHFEIAQIGDFNIDPRARETA